MSAVNSVGSIVTEFRKAYEERHSAARLIAAKRKLVGCLYGNPPEEIIYAAGIIPVQLTAEPENKDAYLAGEQLLAPYFCNFSKSILGQALKGNFDYLSGVILPDVCESMRTFASLWRMNIEQELFCFLPTFREPDPGALNFFRKEIANLKVALESLSGEKVTRGALLEGIRVCNKNRQLLGKLYDLRRAHPWLLSGGDISEIFRAVLVMPKERSNNLMGELLDCLATDTPKEQRHTNRVQSSLRVMISTMVVEECIAAESHAIKMCEDLGCEVVADDLMLRGRYYPDLLHVPEGLDPLEAIVRYYLRHKYGPFKLSATETFSRLLKEAKESSIGGIIFLINKYCSPYCWELPYMEGRFRDEGIPVLMVEAGTAPEAMRTRLQAFAEMLTEPTQL